MEKFSNPKIRITAPVLLLVLSGCGGNTLSIGASIDMLEALGKARINPASKEADRRANSGAGLNRIEILGKPCHLTKPQDEADTLTYKEIKISGEQCPLEYRVATNTNLARSITETHFKAFAEDLKNTSDIESLDMRVESMPNRSEKTSQIQITLNARSQKKGTVEMTLQGLVREQDIHNGSGEISGRLSYEGKESQIRHVIQLIRGIQHDEVYINGDRINPDERDRVLPSLIHQ